MENALRLIATAHVAEPVAASRSRERLAAWCKRSTAHRAAHAEALRRWHVLASAALGLREQFPDPLAAASSPSQAASPARRRLLGMAMAGGGAAGMAGATAWWSWRARQPVFAQSWRTRTAELLRIGLPDAAHGTSSNATGPGRATEIMLSAQTALRATLYRDRREIELTGGEARFDVAADPARRFIVRTPTGRVEVVGTAFTVADRGGLLTVAVDHGRVRLFPAGAATAGARAQRQTATVTTRASLAPIDLGPGDRLSVRNGQAPGPVQRVAPADVGAWRTGWLVFDNAPLAEALPAINAFRHAPLVLADAPTGRLRLTARFRAVDDSGLLAALPAVLPVRIEQRADGSLAVREKR